ncbi:helix-turn-helix domain-containing protein [Streptomyces sp. NPDC006251]|uniref:helix-turn-helix transcriptional regulator n=1 Tax=Streptomyces sp. NPDC006251 TaxID=3155718 RepID=UPI0033B765DD
MTVSEKTASWSGSVTLEPGRLMFAGTVGTTHPHAHAAVQLIVVTAGLVELEDRHGQRRAAQAALIPARVWHAVRGRGAMAVFLYCDPEPALGRVLQDRVPARGRDRLANWIAAADSVRLAGQAPTARQVCDQALQALAVTPRGDSLHCHPAVLAAVGCVQQMLGGTVRLEDVAAQVAISPSRLGHLFAEGLGMSFPVYLRWARLRRAMELARDGHTLTRSAHGAGFADSSHLTRVCHEMFGIAPSEIVRCVRTGTRP